MAGFVFLFLVAVKLFYIILGTLSTNNNEQQAFYGRLSCIQAKVPHRELAENALETLRACMGT